MEIGKGNVIEPLETEEPLRIFARPDNMVQIPLSEYKRYIEDTIKGPTVEIPLSEYMSLREEVGNLRITVEEQGASKQRSNQHCRKCRKKNIRGNKKSDRIGHIEKNGGLRYGRIQH